MADVNWGPVESFGVDHGELEGLSPQECFTLGVEWQMVRAKADQPDGFDQLVHAANRGRVEAMLDKRGREYRLTYMEDDPSESWLMLVVRPR